MHKASKYIILITTLFFLVVFFVEISHFKQDTFELLKEQRNALLNYVETNPFFSYILIFILITLFVITPIPLAAVGKIIGGLLFGVIHGTIFNIIATTTGSIIGYAIGKYTIPQEFYQNYRNKIKKIDAEFQNNGFSYLMILRLSIVFPFFLINLVGGLSEKISFKKYTLSTILSIIPTSFIYAYGGAKLATLNSINDIFSLEIIILLLLIIGFIGMSIVLKKYVEKNKSISS